MPLLLMGEMCLVPAFRGSPTAGLGCATLGAEVDLAFMDCRVFSLAWNLAQANTSLAEGCRGIHRLRKGLGIHHLTLGQPSDVFLLHLGVAQVDMH